MFGAASSAASLRCLHGGRPEVVAQLLAGEVLRLARYSKGGAAGRALFAPADFLLRGGADAAEFQPLVALAEAADANRGAWFRGLMGDKGTALACVAPDGVAAAQRCPRTRALDPNTIELGGVDLEVDVV